MSLQLRFTLLFLAILGLFLLTFSTFWVALGRAHFPSRSHHFGDRVAWLQTHVQESYRRGSRDDFRTGLKTAFLPPDATLLVVWKDGRRERLQGPGAALDEATLARAMAGEGVELAGQPGFHLQSYQPLRRGPDTDGVLVFTWPMMPSTDEHRFLLELAVVALACSGFVTLFTSVAVARFASRPITRLVAATQQLARGNFDIRLKGSRPRELVELESHFRSMAEELQLSMEGLRGAKERAERIEAQRRRFMLEVSHNLRTPLAAIVGWSEAILDGLAEDGGQASVARIHRESIFVGRAIQRLLDWSKWEEQPPALKLERLPISQPVLETADALNDLAEERQIELSLVGMEQEHWVMADLVRTRELLQVLLENAIQHNPPGTRVTLTFRELGARLHIELRDNGLGIPPEIAADLSRRPGGRLGLAIAQKLARAHGDQLLCQVSEGTTFTFSLASAPPDHA